MNERIIGVKNFILLSHGMEKKDIDLVAHDSHEEKLRDRFRERIVVNPKILGRLRSSKILKKIRLFCFLN